MCKLYAHWKSGKITVSKKYRSREEAFRAAQWLFKEFPSELKGIDFNDRTGTYYLHYNPETFAPYRKQAWF